MEIKRDLYLNRLISSRQNGMIKVITGIRRCGKTYLLFTLFYNYLIASGIKEDHIIMIALDDRTNMDLRDPDRLLEYVNKRVTGKQLYYILLDEVQMVAEFEDVLNSFLHIKNADVYVTGSNAKFLSKDVITEFRGRGDEIKLRPLSFKEFLSVYDGSKEDALEEYMTYGGLPQTAIIKDTAQRTDYLKSVFENTYLVDIKQRRRLKNDEELCSLIDIIASSVGSLTNPSKLEKTFHSVIRSNISRKTIKSYLDYLEDAFLIEESRRYDIKGKRYIDTPAKYYFEDLGLRNARLNFRQNEETHLMENLIYNELRLRGFSVDVGQVTLNAKNKKGESIRKQLEVDFVCNQGSKRYYIQSAFAMATQEKVNQEINSLMQIKDGFQKIIITGGIMSSYQNMDGIEIMNIFDFLLK